MPGRAFRSSSESRVPAKSSALVEDSFMSGYLPLSVVHPAAFDPGTAQTSGSLRLAAVTHTLGIQTGLWGGTFLVEPGARTGIHHHGKQETIAYVLEGESRVEWGERGEHSVTVV